jgi:hypothetical protein
MRAQRGEKSSFRIGRRRRGRDRPWNPPRACRVEGAGAAARRYEESLGRFDTAIRLVPGMVMAYVNKGEALRIMGRYPQPLVHLCVLS